MQDIIRGTIFIEDIELGMTCSLEKVIADSDIEMFAKVSTDHNPVHIDEEYAQNSMFKGRIAHGMLSASLISAVIGEQLPGHGTIYMAQNLKFLAPVRPGDTVHAQVTVTDIQPEKSRVKLDCVCTVDGKNVIIGDATVMAPSRTPA